MPDIQDSSGVVISAGERGAILHNETADRIMKSHLVSDAELTSLTKCETDVLFGFSAASFLLSVGITFLVEWQVNAFTAGIFPMVLAFVTSAIFCAWGAKAWGHRKTVLNDIRNPGSENAGEQ